MAAEVNVREPRSSRRRFALAVALCMAILVAAPAALAFTVATSVARGGTIAVDVDDGRRGGDDVHVLLPTALVDLGLAVVPDRVFRDIAREIERSGAGVEAAGLRAVANELRMLPDVVLVEIHDAGSTVVVESLGGRIRLRVDDGDTRVRLDLPTRTAVRVLERIAEST